MKRPGIVWIFTIVIIIGILFELFGFYGILSGMAEVELNAINTASMFISFILMVFRGIMIYHMFNLKRSTIFWTHLSMGSALGVSIIEYAIYFATVGPMGTALIAPPSLIGVAVYVLLWWAIVDYVKNKKIDGQPVFT